MKNILSLTITFLLILTSSAMAYTTIPWTMDEPNTFVDLSAEYYVDNDNNDKLSVGDLLRGVYKIDEITSPNSVDPLPSELTGIFEVEVIEASYLGTSIKRDWGTGSVHGISDFASYTSELWSYTFGASAAFEAIYGTGALMAVYIDDAPGDYQSTGTNPDTGLLITIPESEDTVTNGDVYWTFGLGDTGEWTINVAPNDLEIFKYVDAETTIAGTQVGLNLLTNPIGPELVQNISFQKDDSTWVNVDLRANISLNGIGNLATPYDLKNKVDGVLFPTPEPATFFLLGTGLIGIAYIGRRKNQV